MYVYRKFYFIFYNKISENYEILEKNVLFKCCRVSGTWYRGVDLSLNYSTLLKSYLKINLIFFFWKVHFPQTLFIVKPESVQFYV